MIQKEVASGKKSAYIPEDFKYMNELNIKTIEGVFDVFGDECVVAFPTPGHTPGHQSLMVKLASGKTMVFCADAGYTLENIIEAIPPGLYWDISQSMTALNAFKIMRFMGSEIVPSHDPYYWKYKPLAPKVFEF